MKMEELFYLLKITDSMQFAIDETNEEEKTSRRT